MQALSARRAGDAARDRGDWISAIDHYGQSLQLNKQDKNIMVQYGHVLKEAGQLDTAIGAYRQAIILGPDDADAYLSLGHAYKLAGRLDDAIDAYATAISIENELSVARDELIALGAQDRLPSKITGRTASSLNLARLHRLLEHGLDTAKRLTATSTYPIENYDLFRRNFPIHAPPPSKSASTEITILLEAREASAHEIRASLNSLQNQVHSDWKAVVRVTSELAQHPVASFALNDDRIHFWLDTASGPLDAANTEYDFLLLMDAGTILVPEALSWLCFSATRTGADLTYTDHDYYEAHWQYGNLHRDPVLQPMFDPDDMATTLWVPALVLVQGPSVKSALHSSLTSASLRRALLLGNEDSLRRAHLPRLVASLPYEPKAQIAEATQAPPARTINNHNRILVVIPTRDEAQVLTTCIDSLRACANHPERLDIVVADNRSSLDSQAVFAKIAATGKARFWTVDEAFNWSRINNNAVARAQSGNDTHDLIVFANNDIEGVSQGWDDELDYLFSDPEIGAVGARLLYPDGRVQHAGIILGAHNNRPVHDGLKCSAQDSGPLNRLHRQHGTAAITGAFMATRAIAFRQLNGFDANLAVAYNDVDFCLKLRSEGYRVVYAPSLVFKHHESLSRGTNTTLEKQAWDDSELHSLYERWGEWLFFDPTRNPQWTCRQDHPFDGIQDLTISQVLESLDRSALPHPWAINLTVPKDH